MKQLSCFSYILPVYFIIYNVTSTQRRGVGTEPLRPCSPNISMSELTIADALPLLSFSIGEGTVQLFFWIIHFIFVSSQYYEINKTLKDELFKFSGMLRF